MVKHNADQRVNIRPEVSILSVLRHLNYRPWFAVAEFVDNALQSFLANRDALAANGTVTLKVSIELHSDGDGHIVVRDNAAGIAAREYARAFKPAEVPPDTSGLSEFGMGMKSAACWLARQWSVRTTALGENVERTVSFDVSAIVQHRIEELAIRSRPAESGSHYTEIILTGLHKIPQGRTIGKIKEHLASIYRVFSRDGTLELTFCDESLLYQDPY
jgi:hypothetical protein